MKLEADEKKILDSVERGEWRSARAPKRVLSRYSRSAKATFKKDRRLNIRISTKDLEAIQGTPDLLNDVSVLTVTPRSLGCDLSDSHGLASQIVGAPTGRRSSPAPR
jgi:hypothetical protein